MNSNQWQKYMCSKLICKIHLRTNFHSVLLNITYQIFSIQDEYMFCKFANTIPQFPIYRFSIYTAVLGLQSISTKIWFFRRGTFPINTQYDGFNECLSAILDSNRIFVDGMRSVVVFPFFPLPIFPLYLLKSWRAAGREEKRLWYVKSVVCANQQALCAFEVRLVSRRYAFLSITTISAFFPWQYKFIFLLRSLSLLAFQDNANKHYFTVIYEVSKITQKLD